MCARPSLTSTSNMIRSTLYPSVFVQFLSFTLQNLNPLSPLTFRLSILRSPVAHADQTFRPSNTSFHLFWSPCTLLPLTSTSNPLTAPPSVPLLLQPASVLCVRSRELVPLHRQFSKLALVCSCNVVRLSGNLPFLFVPFHPPLVPAFFPL